VWLLHDLDTVNGSWVDGQPVHGQLPLASGSTIRFGAAEFVFSPHDRWEDSPAAPMRGTADEPGPGFAFGIPDRQGFPTSLWAGLIIVALAIVGVLLLRAG
jgi:pSer/pThr/pTyr-binding forkhead associated (FHA) protein